MIGSIEQGSVLLFFLLICFVDDRATVVLIDGCDRKSSTDTSRFRLHRAVANRVAVAALVISTDEDFAPSDV